ncbi:hypothetical protein [Desulfosporosinus sp. Sb-LF]|uniref:PaaI family thioesterase n=1 Tax=Desulfosporosinus sp. Sb-LF TaxID=2560027 RepID=UPI0018EE6EDE|nr:hypothetical protein [Desulfosporosinus sp. Sb-LF]
MASRMRGTLMEALDIEFVELGPEKVVATMPVNEATRQPAGMLHGGLRWHWLKR